MEGIYESFAEGSGLYGQRLVTGAASLEAAASRLRFAVTDASSKRYSNAQVDDCRGVPRSRLLWRPPLRLTVRARFSASEAHLRGTAGFGFWNDPFLMTEPRLPALPRAIWFFYAGPASNMKLDRQVEGHGWKAATIDASRPSALAWLPAAPLLVPLMNLPGVCRALWPHIQRSLSIREARLGLDMSCWHTYTLQWAAEQSRFSVVSEIMSEPQLVLQAPSPRGPLGFVMWLDNQYLVVTPWGKLRWGLVQIPGRQWMEVDWFRIEPMGEAAGVIA